MIKIWLVVLAAVAALLYYRTHAPVGPTLNASESAEPSPPVERARQTAVSPPTTTFRCEGKQHCREMTSCDEARFYLRNCPSVKIDGDNDGIPCETPPLQCT